VTCQEQMGNVTETKCSILLRRQLGVVCCYCGLVYITVTKKAYTVGVLEHNSSRCCFNSNEGLREHYYFVCLSVHAVSIYAVSMY